MDARSTAGGAPYGLSLESGGDEFPVSGSRPELSWKLPRDSQRQSSFDLHAIVAGEHREYRGDGGRHRFVAWPWSDLRSGELVVWRVRAHTEKGASAWSEFASFEAGLFEEDWRSTWISGPDTDLPVGFRPVYEFSSKFTLAEVPGRARLYASALGMYEVFINDRRIGASELMPGSTSYDQTLYAQASDPLAALVTGDNTVRIRVSDGWFRGRTDAFRKEAQWGAQTAVRAEIHGIDGDARTLLATTNGSWTVSETEVITADLMDGQVSDLRRSPHVLGQASEAQISAPPVSWSPAPPVRVITELPPRSITQVSADDVVVDFGQNASGRVRLEDLGAPGAHTTLVFGEHVGPDGRVTLTHLDTPAPDGSVVPFRQRDEVVSDGSGSSFEPHHTVHGFQYVQIHRDEIRLDPSQIAAQVLHTDLTSVGGFASSDEDLNRLWDVASWSFRGNAVDVPTDCPTRERAGWTGDWQIFVPTAVRIFDVDGFSRKWLQSVRNDQMDDGRIVNISPDPTRRRINPDPATDFATGSAGWGDAIVLVPWELYVHYGDTRVLEENWEAMVRWVEFALRAAADNRHPSRVERSTEPLPHEKYLWDGTFHFGEWCEPTPLSEDGTPGPTIPDPMAWAMADKGEVGTAYLYRSLSTLSRIATILGHDDVAQDYADLAQRTRAAWQQEYIDADGLTPNHTQASYVRALSFGLVPEQLRATAAEHLVGLIRDADYHLGTGFLATADLLPVLSDSGYPEVAERLLMQRSSPSWLGMIDRGATTIWEEWEGIDRNGNAHASLNHYSKGAVIRYLHSHVVGIQQDPGSTAWERFTVAPVIPVGLDWAGGHLDGPQGLIEAEWRLLDDDAVIRVTVPGGSAATVTWGGQSHDVLPGRHEFRTTRAAVSRPITVTS